MATTGVPGFLTRVRGGPVGDARPDAELVRDFADSRSEAAFAELVRRFAPVVWSACRRIIGDYQHAEDAFQAAFLVLARSPRAIRPPTAVGGWLHAVAVHTSLRMRAMIQRRRQRERPTVPDRPAAVAPDPIDPDHLRWLDEEIAQLPAGLRTAVVLCELQGLSRGDAAKRLGIAEGTLSSRLAAARKILAARLRARGVALGAGGLTALVAPATTSAGAPVVAPASGTALALAEGAIRAMFLRKLKLLTVGAVLTALVVALGSTVLSAPAAPERVAVRHSAPVPKAKPGPGRLFVWEGETPLLLRPDGTVFHTFDPVPGATVRAWPGNAKLSPDGQRVAFDGKPDPAAPTPADNWNGLRGGLCVLALAPDKKPRTVKRFQAWTYFWLDPNRLAVSGCELSETGTPSTKVKSWVYDVTTDRRTELPVPENFILEVIAPDGKTALAAEMSAPNDPVRPLHLVSLADGKQTALFDHPVLGVEHALFSPDGSRLLLRVCPVDVDPTKKVGDQDRFTVRWDRLVVVDVKTKKVATIADEDEGLFPSGWKWSPDGKRIAFVGERRQKKMPRALSVTVADADGKNRKDVFEVMSNFGYRGDTGLTVAWAPDGKRLAVLHQMERANGSDEEDRYTIRIVVMGADGTEPSEVHKAAVKSNVLLGFEWK
jgi:RNA polymerase sigma factor (sigma-70 family)